MENPINLERENVFNVYDQIATNFSHTRFRPWEAVVSFLNTLPSGSFVIDLGSGNGKYFKSIIGDFELKNYALGIDTSFELLKLSNEKMTKFGGVDMPWLSDQESENREDLNHFGNVNASIAQLPIRSCSIDGALMIAVMHHISTICKKKKYLYIFL